jgi:cytochrome P450
MPHSFLFGHIPALAKEAPKFPLDAHNQLLMNYVADEYDLRQYGLFYVDIYPIQSDPLLVVISPEVAAQVTQTSQITYPKHPVLNRDFGRSIGPRGIVGQEGSEWKELRTMFNPCFSRANLFSMVPMIVEESEVFASRLSRLAAVDNFVESLESLVAALTVDIIGWALLGMRFNSQTSSNPLVTSIIKASKLTRNLSDFSPERLNLWRILKLRYYEAVSNGKITQMLQRKWSELAASPAQAEGSNAIFDIAIAKYVEKGSKLGDHVTKDFLELMRDK